MNEIEQDKLIKINKSIIMSLKNLLDFVYISYIANIIKKNIYYGVLSLLEYKVML